MIKPSNFDLNKKYLLVFYVYTEPASTAVNETYNGNRNKQYGRW